MAGVVQVEEDGNDLFLTLAEESRPQEVLRALLNHGVEVQLFEVAPVPLEDIFVTVVGKE
jgi:ABC-type uncharacterized transport system ATPase subunit